MVRPGALHKNVNAISIFLSMLHHEETLLAPLAHSFPKHEGGWLNEYLLSVYFFGEVFCTISQIEGMLRIFPVLKQSSDGMLNLRNSPRGLPVSSCWSKKMLLLTFSYQLTPMFIAAGWAEPACLCQTDLPLAFWGCTTLARVSLAVLGPGIVWSCRYCCLAHVPTLASFTDAEGVFFQGLILFHAAEMEVVFTWHQVWA